MGPLEIIVIGLAGFFLLWLWRGGGQPHAVQAGAPRHHGPPRALGCFGSVAALVLGIIALRSMRVGLHVTTLFAVLFVGALFLAMIGRWSGRLVVVGGVILAMFGGIVLMGFLTRTVTHVPNQRGVHWVDDWLDGPAAFLSPQRMARARTQAERQRALARAQIERWQSQTGNGARVLSQATEFSAEGATLHVDFRPQTIGPREVTADALAATVLAMVDLLAADRRDGYSTLNLSTLNQVQVQLRNGGSKPLSEIARLKKHSQLGSSAMITRLALSTSGKSQRQEQEQLQHVYEALDGVERERRKQRGFGDFQIAHDRGRVLLALGHVVEPGIPVEAVLAAEARGASTVAPTAPTKTIAPPAVIGLLPTRKAPEEGTWFDTALAYHVLMWTLPESLGGAARYQSLPSSTVPRAPAEPPLEVAAVAPAERPAEPAPATTPQEPSQPATAVAANAGDASAQPQQRPIWVDGKPEQLDANGVYHMRRSTGRLYDTTDESHEAVAGLLIEMTNEYTRALLGPEAAAKVSIPMHTILDSFVEATWDERGPPPGLPDDDAWETHVLLKFDGADRQLVERAWRASIVNHNLRYAGAGAGLVLALLGTVFGYLKIDTATRGYYSGRLKLATGAVVAALTTLGILLAGGTLPL